MGKLQNLNLSFPIWEMQIIIVLLGKLVEDFEMGKYPWLSFQWKAGCYLQDFGFLVLQ